MLVAAVLVGALGLRSARYDRAVEKWEQKQYIAAARDLYKLRNYRDAAAYRQELESMLMKTLTATAWNSIEANYDQGGYQATGIWKFIFREDYTGTEDHIATDDSGTQVIASDEFTYEFQCNAGRMMIVITYESTQEAPYLLTLAEDGSLKVTKLHGAFQFYEVYDMVDYLPE